MANLASDIVNMNCNSRFVLRLPLAWLNEALEPALCADPSLFKDLLQLDQFQMHVIALAAAHIERELSVELVAFLLRERPKAILSQTIAECPAGLKRALGVLPSWVMPPDAYRQLIVLLRESCTATFLRHRSAIDAASIRRLYALPANRRQPAMFKLLDQVEGMELFASALSFLARRLGEDGEQLAATLGAMGQPKQIIAQVCRWIENLPPPNLPLPTIGSFRRLDKAAETRALAKSWKNCLASYEFSINDGTAAVYLAPDRRCPAVALISRAGRLGWVLEQIKGPKNVDIEPRQFASDQETFFIQAGIPMASDIACLKDIVLRTHWSRALAG